MCIRDRSGSIAPYKSAPIFSTAFSVLGNNPILGILTGAVAVSYTHLDVYKRQSRI